MEGLVVHSVGVVERHSGHVGVHVGRDLLAPRPEALNGLPRHFVERNVGQLGTELQEQRKDVLTVGGPLDAPAPLVRKPVEKPRPHCVECGHVAVVNQKRVLVAKRMRVFVDRIADGGATDVGQEGVSLQTKGSLAVRFATRRRLDLPKATGTAIVETRHSPSVRVRQAAGVAAALIDERVLGIEQLALGTGGVGGLQGIEAAHSCVEGWAFCVGFLDWALGKGRSRRNVRLARRV